MKSFLENLELQHLTEKFLRPSDEDISTLEEDIGFELPNSYKEFLRVYGASFFAKNVAFRSLIASPWDVDGLKRFDAFYGISDDSEDDIGSINRRLRTDLPAYTIAIGYDPGSNHILLTKTGEVLFFDRDSKQTFLVAKDFEGFLKSFVERE